MRCKIFKDFKKAIRDYCFDNSLNFDKLRASPCCYDDTELIILYSDPGKENQPWEMLDDTPMPPTLEIFLENGKLRFVQTDITHKYLGIGGEAEKPVMPSRPVRVPKSSELAYA